MMPWFGGRLEGNSVRPSGDAARLFLGQYPVPTLASGACSLSALEILSLDQADAQWQLALRSHCHRDGNQVMRPSSNTINLVPVAQSKTSTKSFGYRFSR